MIRWSGSKIITPVMCGDDSLRRTWANSESASRNCAAFEELSSQHRGCVPSLVRTVYAVIENIHSREPPRTIFSA